jgi:1-acyl-sn-glycerol-3-phosphate acyltransferase
VSAEAAVQPVALQYIEGTAREPSRAVAYIGDDSLIGSIWRTLCAREVQAVVSFGRPHRVEGRDRRTWARELRETIIAMR